MMTVGTSILFSYYNIWTINHGSQSLINFLTSSDRELARIITKYHNDYEPHNWHFN